MSAGIKVVGKRKLLLLVMVAAALAALSWHLKNHLTLGQLVAQETNLREVIVQHPWSSFGIGLVIYTCVSLVPGTSGKSVVFGWLYGFWQGVAIIILGLTAAAMTIFYLSRYVVRGWIEHRYGSFLAVLNRHLIKEGAFYLLSLRMAHFPFTITNLASGASRVQSRTFCWTTSLGLLPGTAVFAYVGVRLPSLDELAKNGPGSLIDAPLIAALALSAVFPFVFRTVARKLGLLKDTDIDPDLPIATQ